MDDISDHFPILLLIGDVKFKVNLNRMIRYVRNMSESNLVDFKQKENQKMTCDLSDDCDFNKLYENFHNKLILTYNEALPLKLKIIKLHQKKYNSWLTTAILNSVKKK